jgi:hypothetical protein
LLLGGDALKSRVYTIDKFTGINESPDGDTGLNMGEAADMLNFRITKEGNLQIRPGYKSVATIADGHPIRGMWHGYVNGVERWLVACNGHIYSLNLTTYASTDIGTLTDDITTFFPYSDKVYILNGHEYKSWDGTTFTDVAGYVPLIATACAPATGGGTLVQQVNKLTGKRWKKYSGTGTDTVYYLAETSIASVDSVYIGGALQSPTAYSVDLTLGKITFTAAPAAGTDNVDIYWTYPSSGRSTILAQRFAETYNGATDNRVFLYGDGMNKAYYSDLEYTTGLPTAEYFPDLNVLNVGEENTPITSIIRNFNKLLTFKTDSTYITDYDYITLADGSTTAGFYTRAIEKDIGNTPYGQVKLVNNYPISVFGNSVYRWGLIYTSGTQDERNSKRISDRVRNTLESFSMDSVVTFDDEWNREFWIVNTDGKACVYSYANEADTTGSYLKNPWFVYDNITATCMIQIGGEVYFGSDDGYIMRVSRDYRNDNGTNIDALWESGSMAFDAEYIRKIISKFYISVKPESAGRITSTFETDIKSDFDERVISCNLAAFEHADFSHWSFDTNWKPHTKRVKLKAKKFAFLKLILSSDSKVATVTVQSVDLPVTYTGYVK